ncbi:MAG TPA: DUF2723 domain-containing protein [Kofleriaceae bacterium]|jgi:hypothetical protein|nr:DUF2723 domain-containing protein [Kofleriaceae bacterium]
MGRLTPRVLLIDRGGLIVLVALATYVWIAPPYIVDGDNAEFATLGTVGGVAHPSGYPAYLLWLRATAWLPGATPAHTAAIATAILAAIQLAVLHAACRAWGARSTAATLAIAVYAAGPLVMRYSSEAEVFALDQLVVAAVLYLAAQAGPLRGGLRVAALGLVAGVGIADHMTCVLAAPVGLLGAVRGVREARRPAAAAAGGAAALVVGLLPYAYLFVTRETSISWGSVHTAGELLDHALRVAYGGPGAFSGVSGRLHVTVNLTELAVSVGRGWCWVPAIAGLAVLGYRCVRPGVGEPRDPLSLNEPRIGWQMLALAFVVAGPLLVARFDLALRGLTFYVVRRFHLLPTLLLAPAVAAAFELAIRRLGSRLRPAVGAGIAALGFATAALIAIPAVLRVRTPAVDHAMRGLLHGLPQNAVVMGAGDIPHFSIGYLQDVCGERRDVIHVYWHSVGIRWYRDRLARRGLVIDTAANGKPSVRIAEQILASGRPLLVDTALGNILTEFPSYPYGMMLFRVLPRGQPLPSLDEVAALNRAWFAALDLDYPLPGLDDEYPTLMHEEYAEVWRIIADGYAKLGRPDAAAEAAARMQALRPHE